MLWTEIAKYSGSRLMKGSTLAMFVKRLPRVQYNYSWGRWVWVLRDWWVPSPQAPATILIKFVGNQRDHNQRYPFWGSPKLLDWRLSDWSGTFRSKGDPAGLTKVAWLKTMLGEDNFRGENASRSRGEKAEVELVVQFSKIPNEKLVRNRSGEITAIWEDGKNGVTLWI